MYTHSQSTVASGNWQTSLPVTCYLFFSYLAYKPVTGCKFWPIWW